jgi:hypothetical protein
LANLFRASIPRRINEKNLFTVRLKAFVLSVFHGHARREEGYLVAHFEEILYPVVNENRSADNAGSREYFG